MFESVILLQNQFIKFCNSNNFLYQLNDTHLKNYIVLSSFLFTFKEATELLLESYYLTTHHIFPTLAKVAHIFSEYNFILNIVFFMKSMFEKYKKYYEDIPILYCMTLYLDSRMKTCGFYSIIKYLFYETLDFDETIRFKQFRIKT
jgi:hypothetical protein